MSDISSVSYKDALATGKRVGASHADDVSLMALFCDSSLQILCGAVSPELVFNGAQKKGMTTRELTSLVSSDKNAVHDLMWI